MNFSFFYKESFPEGNIVLPQYDYFISAFDACERTSKIYEKIDSKFKIWLVFPHYHIAEEELPDTESYTSVEFKEDDYFQDFFATKNFQEQDKICIDITGFIKPHLIFLIKYLVTIIGVKKIEFLYTEPHRYLNADETKFSGFIDDIRPIEGCNSIDINTNTENDVLIISAGYDDNLIAKVCQEKNSCKNKFYILGFPSLQPDMYQESRLKVHKIKESTGDIKLLFAPAYDPFITAETLGEIIALCPNYTNIYISPLATKSHALGFVLYYLWNLDKPINIIYPYSNFYSAKNAIGIKKTWKYTLEFP
ncbi:hypothetical protein CAP35_06585 [Chitinophagaceae bacterium IBVUCB1]|nr:hypothetical protein CAP35_06585 [Chitinophagaceae bacterium IBVUCB1]